MKVEKCLITEIRKLSYSIYSLKFISSILKDISTPGQFINIKVDDNSPQILRRPFSISDINQNEITILFNVVGKGTFSLSKKKEGDYIDVLGPLGNGFSSNIEFGKIVILGGGIGVAPFPFLIRKLKKENKNISIFFGFRNSKDVINFSEFTYEISTDDGSLGFKGNVIELFLSKLSDYQRSNTKIIACGPTVMLKNLEILYQKFNFEIEVSIESYMACGLGICQGCPVNAKNEKRNFLVCKDGPCFNLNDIIL